MHGSGSVGLHCDYRPKAAPSHPLAAQALAFWQARPADGIVIGRDVPSRAIAAQLNRIIVQEPLDGGRDLKVRLTGNVVRERFGLEMTGKSVSQLFPDSAVRIALAMTAIATGEPCFADSILGNGRLEVIHSEHIILPVFAPNHADKWAMTLCCFFG
jgi:hypothetical protein